MLPRNGWESESNEARNVRVERLQEQGLIDHQGEVTGQLRRWHAFLAITAVRRTPGRPQIQTFRCLKPVLGMPGGATIDVCRESMVGYLKEGKTVITATRDDRLDLWKEGCQVHLTGQGSIRCDGADKRRQRWKSAGICAVDLAALIGLPDRRTSMAAVARRAARVDHRPGRRQCRRAPAPQVGARFSRRAPKVRHSIAHGCSAAESRVSRSKGTACREEASTKILLFDQAPSPRPQRTCRLIPRH